MAFMVLNKEGAGMLRTFLKSKKKSIRIIRVVLSMVLLIVVGQLLRQAYNWHIENRTRNYIERFDKETQKYINLPVIKKEIIPTNENYDGYKIINELYSIKCWIDHYVPYQQDIDTLFIVHSKAGVQICGERNKRIMIDYFKEQFEW